MKTFPADIKASLSELADLSGYKDQRSLFWGEAEGGLGRYPGGNIGYDTIRYDNFI